MASDHSEISSLCCGPMCGQARQPQGPGDQYGSREPRERGLTQVGRAHAWWWVSVSASDFTGALASQKEKETLGPRRCRCWGLGVTVHRPGE